MSPNFDGTGPRGKGAMTGRGRGFCVIPEKEGIIKKIGRKLRLLRGCGYGRGLGRRNER